MHSITLHCMRYFLATKIYIRNFSNQNLFPRQTIDILYTQIDYIFTKLSYFHWILKLNKNLSVLFYLFEFFSKLIDQKCLECQFKNNFFKKNTRIIQWAIESNIGCEINCWLMHENVWNFSIIWSIFRSTLSITHSKNATESKIQN